MLKDEELRKKYDQFGEEGLNKQFEDQYQSWQFYRDNFGTDCYFLFACITHNLRYTKLTISKGIYDDDIEVVTLSRADFNDEVFGSGGLWFINFYSTFCSHCHVLAPTVIFFIYDNFRVLKVNLVAQICKRNE